MGYNFIRDYYLKKRRKAGGGGSGKELSLLIALANGIVNDICYPLASKADNKTHVP